MTNTEEQALIKKLAGNAGTFAAEYALANRKWFVGKLIDFFESQSTPDSEMEHDVTVFITAAKKAVTDKIKKGFSTAGLAEIWKLDNLT
jgi:hypothetical protein